MARSALGVLLRALREGRKLTLREVARLAGVHHVYYYRLETGAKESPSEEKIGKLARGLKPQKREADLLSYLAAHDTDPALVEFVLGDPSVTFDEFTALAGAVYRGAPKRDYKEWLERVRKMLAKEGEDG